MSDQQNQYLQTLFKRPREDLDVWREALANLRQLHNDTWNGVRFFLALNAVIFAAEGAVILKIQDSPTCIFAADLIFISAAGAALTWVARKILVGHRKYYVHMLTKKTLIENALGLYDISLAPGIDASFPWGVDKQFVQKLKSDPAQWQNEQMWRSNLISTWIKRIYEWAIAFHVLAFVAGLIVLLKDHICFY